MSYQGHHDDRNWLFFVQERALQTLEYFFGSPCTFCQNVRKNLPSCNDWLILWGELISTQQLNSRSSKTLLLQDKAKQMCFVSAVSWLGWNRVWGYWNYQAVRLMLLKWLFNICLLKRPNPIWPPSGQHCSLRSIWLFCIKSDYPQPSPSVLLTPCRGAIVLGFR